ILRDETDFLLQFAKQRIFDPFAAIDSALRELPAPPAHSPAQEQLLGTAHQYDPYVRSEAVPVDGVVGMLCGHGANCSISGGQPLEVAAKSASRRRIARSS